MHLDRLLSGKLPVKTAKTKVKKAVNSIARILSNIYEPGVAGGGANLDRMLLFVIKSIAPFGASLWMKKAVNTEANKNFFRKGTKVDALRITQALSHG